MDRRPPSRARRRMRPTLVATIDVVLIAVCLVIFALFDHVLPRALEADQSRSVYAASTASYALAQEGSATATVALATSDTFTDGEVVWTDSAYQSDDVSVTLTCVEDDGVTYYVEDIYVSDVSHLRSAFAGDAYGTAITDSVLDMAEDNDAIAAVNGDYYGIGTDGVVIRNGVLYSSEVDGDVCVLYLDGTMATYPAGGFDADEAMAAGAWQAWDFGPALLDSDGEALTDFGSSRIARANPRTAIGYYEPGHYCFVVVDGRQQGYSDGLTLAGLASLMEDLGCTSAYNLDGGKSSNMTFGDELANQPTEGGREVTDIIYVAE